MFFNFVRNSKFSFILLLISIITLLPTLFYPEANDQSIFHFIGKSLLNGERLYVDIIDIKPPVIYYFYALIVKISNSNQFVVRLIDIIWQILAILIGGKLIFKLSENKSIAYYFAIIYGVLYTSIGYTGTGQAEGFLSLPIALSLYLHFQENQNSNKVILQGVILGLFCSLKLTFLILILPFAMDYILNKRYKFLILFTIAFIISSSLQYLIFINNDIYLGFGTMLKYLVSYSNHVPVDAEGFKIIFKKGSGSLADFLSISLCFFFVCGVLFNFKSQFKSQKLITLSLLTFLLLIVSIIIERKFYSYHYLRIYFISSIICAFGLHNFLTLIIWKKLDKLTKSTIGLLLVLLLYFSPIIRFTQSTKIMYFYLSSQTKYDNFFTNKSKFEYNRVEEQKLANLINQNLNQNDFVYVMGMFNSKIHLLLKPHKHNSLTQSCFVYSMESPIEYYKIHTNEIRRADLILVNTDDFDGIVNPKTSYNSLQNDTKNINYINNNFSQLDSIANYVIYKRKN